MIHDAQQHAYEWHDMAMRAHQNVAEMSEEGIRRMFHTAVLNYWTQLKRFKHSGHVRDIWKDEITVTRDDEEVAVVRDSMSLAELGKLRFNSETTTGGELDPTTGKMTQARERPTSLKIQESAHVLDQLDKVANRLQFDANAKEERDRYGSVKVDEDDDHHGVEVPVDAD
jgi:hypothetical protein